MGSYSSGKLLNWNISRLRTALLKNGLIITDPGPNPQWDTCFLAVKCACTGIRIFDGKHTFNDGRLVSLIQLLSMKKKSFPPLC